MPVLTTVVMGLVHGILSFLFFLTKFLCPIEPQVERAGGIRVLVELRHRCGSVGSDYICALDPACCPSRSVQVRASWGRVCVWSEQLEGDTAFSRPQGLPQVWWFLVLFIPFLPLSPGVTTSFRNLLVDDLEPLITAVSGMALSVAQMLTTPLVIAVSPHWGRRWRDLCPLKPGCWGTPNSKGSPSIVFSNSLGSGAQLSGQGGDSGTF